MYDKPFSNRGSRPKAPSICDRCNSRDYCANRAPGMSGCENFNKFPRAGRGEPKDPRRQ